MPEPFHFATLITDYYLKLMLENHPNFIPRDYRSGLSSQDQLRKVSFFSRFVAAKAAAQTARRMSSGG